MTDKCPDNERTLRHRLHIGTAQTMKRVKGQFVPPARALFLRLVSQTSPTLPPALTHLCPHQHPGPLSPYLCHIKSSMHAHKYQCYRHTHILSLPSCWCTWAGCCHRIGNWRTAGCVTITWIICLWKSVRSGQKREKRLHRQSEKGVNVFARERKKGREEETKADYYSRET